MQILIHMQVLKVDSEKNSIVQNNNYSFLLSKYTFSLSTSYFLCFEQAPL